MSKYTISVPLSVKGFQDYARKIIYIEDNAYKMQELFLKYSLEYIKTQANIHLREAYHDSDWYIRTGELENSWETNVGGIIGRLKNVAPYSAFVEYGTGAIGKHPLASQHGYEYNVNNHEGGWYFEADGYEGTHFTMGNEGYWYLYQAVVDDYLNSNKAQEFFDKAFTKVMKARLK